MMGDLDLSNCDPVSHQSSGSEEECDDENDNFEEEVLDIDQE